MRLAALYLTETLVLVCLSGDVGGVHASVSLRLWNLEVGIWYFQSLSILVIKTGPLIQPGAHPVSQLVYP